MGVRCSNTHERGGRFSSRVTISAALASCLTFLVRQRALSAVSFAVSKALVLMELHCSINIFLCGESYSRS